MQKPNIKEKTAKLSAARMIKLAAKIRRMSRQQVKLPEDFDVLKFIHDNR